TRSATLPMLGLRQPAMLRSTRDVPASTRPASARPRNERGMIPSSFNQIFQTGRMRQEALLAEAERERRAMQVVAAEEARVASPDRARRPANDADVAAARRSRLAAALGWFARSLRPAS